MARNVERAAPNRFVTLTTDAKLWEDGRAAFDGVRRKLPDFTKAIRKKIGKFEYVRVLELHKNGMPHWHLLVRSAYIPQKTISEVWASLTGSVIVDVRKACKGKHAARYVMKYMTKCKSIPWTNRRVSWSKGFFLPQPPSEKEDWQLRHKSFDLTEPAIVMQNEYPGFHAMRCGPYAWLLSPKPITSGPASQKEAQQLVTCIEDCGN